MLSSLFIKNFVLIESSKLEFTKNFTAITGETGSGKSILLHAINLISGERADFTVIGKHSDKSIVEATFTEISKEISNVLLKMELDQQEELILRREITKAGRSRAFINDTPVSLTDLKLISENLIEINSQNQTLELKDPKLHLKILDALAGTSELLNEYREEFKSYKSFQKELQRAEEDYASNLKQQDYNNFQLQELEELSLLTVNYEKIEDDLLRFEKSDELVKAFQAIASVVSQNEQGVENQLKALRNSISKNTADDAQLNELDLRIKSVLIELNDLGLEAENQVENFTFDAQEMYDLRLKLDKYLSVLRKHQLNNQKELVAFMQGIENSNTSLEKLAQDIETLKNALLSSEKNCKSLSLKLSGLRKESSKSIETSVVERLTELKMPESQFKIEINYTNTLTENGADEVQIYFSANRGIAPNLLQKVASGGELSRLMLVLKAMMSSKKQLPSILFDEIDTGVSGDVAEKIGLTLREMGNNMQIIAITHLPQVAAKAQSHKKVEKEVIDDSTSTSVSDLDKDSRIVEIARLVSGSEINDTALKHAKALMN